MIDLTEDENLPPTNKSLTLETGKSTKNVDETHQVNKGTYPQLCIKDKVMYEKNGDTSFVKKTSTSNTAIPKVVTCFTEGRYPNSKVNPTMVDTLTNNDTTSVSNENDISLS